MQNKWGKRLCLFLVVAIFFASMPITAHAEIRSQGIDGAFAPDWNDVKSEYQDAFQWDPDKILTQKWTDGNTEYERQTGFQTEFFQDNIETTHKYLGISVDSGIGGGGGGGGGSGSSIVAVALGELGKPGSLESPPGSNQTKYCDWFWGKGVGNEWCAAFVSWCANECGYLNSVIPKNASCSIMFRQLTGEYGYAAYRIKDTTPWGGSSYTPVPGDLMFFSQTGNLSSAKPFEHIGIIVEVEANGWYTVDGNTTGGGQIKGNHGVAKNHFTNTTSQARVQNGYVVHVEYPTVPSGSDNIDTTFQFLTQIMGLNNAAACGIIANMNAESTGLVPDQNEIGGGGGYGICQWTDTKYAKRRTELFNWCESNNEDPTSLSGQLLFFQYELTQKSAFSTLYGKLKAVSNTANGAAEAAEDFCRAYEIPQGLEDAVNKRRASAMNDFWPVYGNRE